MAHHGGGTWGRAEEARWCEEEGFLHERGCEGGEQLRFQPRVGFGQRNRGRFRPLFGHKPPFGHKLREAGGRARRDGLTSRTGRYFGAPVPRGSNQQVGGNMFKRRWDEPALMKEGGSSRGIGEMTQTKEEAKGGGESKKPGQIKVGDVVFPVNSEVKKGKNCVSEFDDDDDDLLEFDEEPRVEKKGVDENGEEVEFNLEDWDGDEEDDVLEEVYERVEREEMEENEAGVQQEKIVQLANVGEVLVTPKRASERLMGSSGRHSLEKAKSKKAWMNLDPLSGRVVVSNLKT
uniref:Uncharacterized protein n=1 Tax=Oryza rufipogon TaxID=4529 RepID=A0A0E0R8U7_ORYRU